MEITDLGDNLRQVTLSGRLDTPGVSRIEAEFAEALVAAGRSAVVDLSRVDFVASLGIRMFIAVARGLKGRQAKLALYAPQQMVKEVFDTVSLSEIMPICADASAAIAAVRA